MQITPKYLFLCILFHYLFDFYSVTMSSKRKVLSIEDKVSVIRAIESGGKMCDVSRLLGLPRTTVSTIWQSKEKISKAAAQGNSLKKLRVPTFDQIDRAMLQWFQQQRAKHVPLSGPIVKAKAEVFAQQLDIKDFKASEGWLYRFKRRHGITYGQISGEARDVNRYVTNGWLDKVWPELQARYPPENIFNADETGVFFKMTPDKTLKFKNEKCVGGKMSKERITVLVAANMSGTVKRKLLVIGKSKNPRCFKHIKRLPVTYKANKSAWMTSQLFEEEVRKWDADLKDRKILLLLDNCPAHPRICNLKNIELAFFPANTTSVLQPMDQSVIKSFKSHYRKKVLMEIIDSDGKVSINMLTAVDLLSKAWDEVTPATIQHSFRHAGLTHTTQELVPESSEEDLPLSEWVKQFVMPVFFEPEAIENFVEVDDNLVTSSEMSDEDILIAVQGEHEEREDEEDEEMVESEPPTIQQALEAAKLLSGFFKTHDFTVAEVRQVDQIEDKVRGALWRSRKVQTKLTDYFK